MRFTLIINSSEDRDLSYGLVFVPSPVWVQGTRQIVNLTPENPHYGRGGVKRLLTAERIQLGPERARRCVVVAHPDGHARADDMIELVSDLEDEDFAVTLLQTSAS
jgi:hypothetical protein